MMKVLNHLLIITLFSVPFYAINIHDLKMLIYGHKFGLFGNDYPKSRFFERVSLKLGYSTIFYYRYNK